MSDLTDTALDALIEKSNRLPGPKSDHCADETEEFRFHLHVHAAGLLAEIRRHRAARAADRERVRMTVRDEMMSALVDGGPIETPMEAIAIADRVADALASPALSMPSIDARAAVEGEIRTALDCSGPLYASESTRIRDLASNVVARLAPALTAERVRSVVAEVARRVLYESPEGEPYINARADAVADRAAERLCGEGSYESCPKCLYWIGLTTHPCAEHRDRLAPPPSEATRGVVLSDDELMHLRHVRAVIDKLIAAHRKVP